MKVSENKVVTFNILELTKEQAQALLVALVTVSNEPNRFTRSTVKNCKVMRDELRELIY